MKSQEPTLSTTPPLWENGVERTLLPVELLPTPETPPSDAARLQDEAVARTVSILRDKISRSSK